MKTFFLKATALILTLALFFTLVACEGIPIFSKESTQEQSGTEEKDIDKKTETSIENSTETSTEASETKNAAALTVTAEMINEKQYCFAPAQSSDSSSFLVKDSYKDADNYYYLIYLGTVYNVPLVESEIITYNAESAGIRHELTFAKITTKSLETASSKVVSRLEYDSWFGGFDFGLKIGELFSFSIGLDVNTNTTTTTGSSSTKTAEETTVSETRTLELSLNRDCPFGTYRISRAKDYMVYAFAQKKLASDEICVSYKAVPCEGIINLIEYTQEKRFPASNKIENFSFDGQLVKTLPTPAKTYGEITTPDPIDTFWTPITVTMNRYNCNNDNGYNKNQQTNLLNLQMHDNFELGELRLYGCQETNNKFVIKNSDDFSLKWRVLENVTDLPSETKAYSLSEDSNSNVIGTNISKSVKHGAYWVRITYTDDYQNQFNDTDIMKNATKDTFVELINSNSLKEKKKIKKIEVVIVYELQPKIPLVLSPFFSNWRLEYTFDFE